MKNLKLFAAALAVVLIAGVCIFYACTKDKNILTNLTPEAEFAAKIHKDMCVQVNVYRDKNNDVHITTTQIETDPEMSCGFIIPKTLNIEPQQTKEDDGIVIEIPDDAIYWLVPLDGNEPIKFELVKGAKVGANTVTAKCTCCLRRQNCTGALTCRDPRVRQGPNGTIIIDCLPTASGCCADCNVVLKAGADSKGGFLLGSSYLVQSNSITMNGITYQ